jgi:hypothetical protein
MEEMMYFEIPKQFELLNRTVTVEYDPKLLYRENLVGEARYRECKIILQSNTDEHPISDDDLFHNFMHELIHFVLLSAGEKEMTKNEELVDLISGLLAQFFKTITL